ncbi:MAG: hypothetical protein HY863_09135 [Chloroflexi bacterium]|nr:hypothetical protein [Chloroflexota bacterium]
MKDDILLLTRFGFYYGVGFVIIEGVLVPFTRWGQYAPGTFLVWHTPFYLVPIWCVVGALLAYANQKLENLLPTHLYSRMGIVFLVMFLCAFFGEAAGAWLHLWNFSKTAMTLLEVPFWVPLSYACAFSMSPLIYKKKAGGLIQVLLVGCFWQLSHLFTW